MESNTIKENLRKKHARHANNSQEIDEKINEEKGNITKNKRGRPRKSPKRNVENIHEEGPSPKSKRKRVDFTDDEQLEQSTSHSPHRNKTENDSSQTRKRNRNSSMSEFGDASEPQSFRSARNRQPSRRLVESKMSEELVKEQLTVRKRVSAPKQEDHPEADNFHETDSTELDVHHTDSTDVKNETPKQKRIIKKKVIKTEIDQTPLAVSEPISTSQQNVSEQPKVFFKTVTQQPELPAESVYVAGKKQPIATTAKPIVPARSATKIVGGSAPVVIPRTTGVIRRIEKTRPPLHLPAKIVATTAASNLAEKSSKMLIARLQKEAKSAQFVETIEKHNVSDNNDNQTVGAYDDLSQVANEEVVGEQVMPSEQSNVNVANQKEILDNIKIEPQLADDDDEAPPQLQAEKPTHEAFPRNQVFVENDGVVRCHSPGGNTQFVTVTRGADGELTFLGKFQNRHPHVSHHPRPDQPSIAAGGVINCEGRLPIPHWAPTVVNGGRIWNS